MADIELVIKIPERIHYGIEKGITVNGSKASQILIDAVKNSTPLPKGHGRLIDADEYKEHLYACETNGRPLHIMELDERLATVDEAMIVILIMQHFVIVVIYYNRK